MRKIKWKYYSFMTKIYRFIFNLLWNSPFILPTSHWIYQNSIKFNDKCVDLLGKDYEGFTWEGNKEDAKSNPNRI